jgi:NAD(P)-dependent dehydrogenase (short-subunit alcohol dehydrogenase family)
MTATVLAPADRKRRERRFGIFSILVAALMGMVFATSARGTHATFVLTDARGQLFELPNLVVSVVPTVLVLTAAVIAIAVKQFSTGFGDKAVIVVGLVAALFVATRTAARHMKEGSRIITIGSNLAERVPFPGISVYALSKSALIGFTKGVARDLGPKGINVNLVHPGSTDTDMNPAEGQTADVQRNLMAIKRYNDAAEIAGLVAWLAGPESRGITGAGFTVDGGANA